MAPSRAAPLPAALALFLLVAVAGPALAERDGPVFELKGRSMHLSLTNPADNSTFNVRVGRVLEVTDGGTPVPGHALPALASLQPAATYGESLQIVY